MSSGDSVKSMGDYGRLLRRRWIYPAVIIPAVMVLAILLAYSLPVSYRATGSIMLEPSSLPSDLVPSTVTGPSDVNLYAAQQLDLARRAVMTPERLAELVGKHDPYPDEPGMTVSEKAELIDENTLMEAVDPTTFEPTAYSNTFSIHYENPDPRVAAKLGTELVDLVLMSNRLARADQAQNAYKFLKVQADELVASMGAMEKKLAQFKERYGDALPTAQGRNLAGVERSQRDLESLQRDIRAAEERESLLSLQLSELSPSLTVAVSNWRTELARLKSELALAEQKYTQEHPDVRRLKRAISDLAQQGAAADGTQSAKPDNPEYLRVRSQLYAAQRELAGLRASAGRARSELSGFESNLATAPNVEREYLQLAREYDAAQGRYQDLQDKLKAASLAQTLEREALGERFTLVRKPYTPKKPYSPNRLGIILLGFVLGAGLAILAVAMVDSADPTVRSSDDLKGVIEGMPLGAVPVIFNAGDLLQRRQRLASVAIGCVGVAVIVAVRIFTAA